MKLKQSLALLGVVGLASIGVAATSWPALSAGPPAYAVIETNVTDTDAYKTYLARVKLAVEANGGQFLARGGKTLTIEGAAPAQRVTLVQFPSLEQAGKFYKSNAYQDLLPLRQTSATVRIFVVEGLAP